ncbi:MAG: FAD-dependent thymidylate synthase [Limnoraphis sp. WC205]|nr:FAD-dependent thymidylate synthase [Limnoraphis sp. WC205]
MDKFRVEVIAQTPNPQTVIYAAMHQDYSDQFIIDERDQWPSETKCGEIIVKRLLAGERGHYGPLEHVQIVFNCGYFPHSVMQQARTHRVGISFDVQCLAADTEITFVNIEGETSPKLRKTIGELYDLWTNGEKAIRERSIRGRNGEPPGEYRRDCKNRIRKMRLRVLNEETGEFTTGSIKDVMCSGVQPVYRLTLEDGKTLDCTVNHRLLTDKGWQTMGDAVGLITDFDGNVIQITKPISLMCNGQTVVEEKKKLIAHPVKVIKVEYFGEQMTYDIEVEGKWHNFVANGLVVHNSFRYTGQQFIEVLEGKKDLEDVFYLRPVGDYTNRQGKKYYYSSEQRQADFDWCLEAVKRYQIDFENGMSEEHARGKLPFDYRQHFVVSLNLRTLLHFLDLRFKKDAQLEIQKLCELMWPHLETWAPEVAGWYKTTRMGKARLSP